MVVADVGDLKSKLALTPALDVLGAWPLDPSVGEIIASASFSLGILVEVWGVLRMAMPITQLHDLDAVIAPVCG